MKLKTDRDGWISGQSAIGEEMVAFYQNLFASSHPDIPIDLEQLIEPLITTEDNLRLTQVPDDEEIYSTLKKMSLEKTLGLDGMTVLFFKYF